MLLVNITVFVKMSSLRGKEEVLLLGMVFSAEFQPKVGQEFRDRVRCEALERLGYSVKTLDDKHSDNLLHGKHCRANFTQARRLLTSMESKWGSIQLNHIILDYYFSPVGWARVRWSDPFFTETLPMLAREKLLSVGGKIWLPNLQCIRESIGRYRTTIDQYYIVHDISDPMQNPLYYVATENAYDELMRIPEGGLTNASQLQPILDQATFPFLALVLKDPNDYWCCDKDDDDDEVKRQKVDDGDHASRTLLMWDSIVATPKQVGRTKIVRVFLGGKDSTQSGPFLSAMATFRKKWASSVNIVLETINTEELGLLKWQPDQFVDWYLQSHVHFLIAHVHQSLLHRALLWDMEFACQQYTRLQYNVGFPSGDQLRCPVFTQDKIKYIECLDRLAVKTMTIPLTFDGQYDSSYLSDVKRLVN
jgi:hypothetical protein